MIDTGASLCVISPELAEAELLSAYLPKQRDDDELTAIVDKAGAAVAEQTGAQPG